MIRKLKYLLLLFPLLAAVQGVSAQDDGACQGISGRLRPDMWARVGSGSANNLRQAPTTSAEIIGRIPDGDIFRVVDGPECSDGYVWWSVDYAGTIGWTAEGKTDPATPWLEPLAGQPEEMVEYPDDTEGCQRPPDDYARIWLDWAQLNLRTLAMLDHAQALYRAEGGIVNFRRAIMQGSYNPGGVAASFGTHDGGGALDLSVRDPVDRHVLTDEIPLMLRALRLAGFAAWLRDTDSLYPGSPIHIHAIAIGDEELSEAAREQIDGTFGYLRGYNGLPREDGIPQPDTSGEMVVCGWMTDLGYGDMRDQ